MRTRISAIALAIATAALGAACNSDENSPTGPSVVPNAATSTEQTTSTAPRYEPTTRADGISGAPSATFGDGAQTMRGFASGRPGGWSEEMCAEIEAPDDPDVGYEFCMEKPKGRSTRLGWFASRGAEMRSRGLNTMGTVWVHEVPQPKCHWAGGGTNPRENVVCRILWPGTTDPAKVRNNDLGYAIARQSDGGNERPAVLVENVQPPRRGLRLRMLSPNGQATGDVRVCTSRITPEECWDATESRVFLTSGFKGSRSSGGRDRTSSTTPSRPRPTRPGGKRGCTANPPAGSTTR